MKPTELVFVFVAVIEVVDVSCVETKAQSQISDLALAITPGHRGLGRREARARNNDRSRRYGNRQSRDIEAAGRFHATARSGKRSGAGRRRAGRDV